MFIGLLRKENTVKDHFGLCRPVVTPDPEEVSHFVKGEICKRDGTVFEETLDGIKELERQGTFMKEYFSKNNCDVTNKVNDKPREGSKNITKRVREGTGEIFGTTNVTRKVTHPTASPSRAVFGKSANIVARKSPKRAVNTALFSGPTGNGPQWESKSITTPSTGYICPRTKTPDVVIGTTNNLLSYFGPKATTTENKVPDNSRKSVDKSGLESYGNNAGTLLEFVRNKQSRK